MSTTTFTDCHCHTNVDWVCDRDLTPSVYADAIGDVMSRVVITDHGFMLYWHDRKTIFKGDWVTNPDLFDQAREWGNARVRWNIERTRALANPNVFVGIETDLMRDGRLTHDPVFNADFDVIVCSCHFLPWFKDKQPDARSLSLWLDHVEQLVFTPAVDVFGHPFRWLTGTQGVSGVPNEVIDKVLAFVEQSRVTIEINVRTPHALYYAALGKLVRGVVDKGLPLVFGSDAHRKCQIADFSAHVEFVRKLGMSMEDLNVRALEGFLARKGQRDRIESRPT